ncbi:MAG: outer membrane lipoprotein chaperone LolA [Arhodomonas sp.]|nr:outer membrane lipoprotein chaperone LolA [Arhodomonas sp.]
MKRWYRLLLVLLVLAFPLRAASPDELAEFYQSVDSLRGSFVQVTRDEEGRVLERAEGRFVIQRPERFNWLYETPYEQRIVGDGEWLWVHDRDLRQVTVRPVEEVLGVGPALLLSGSLEALEARFRIEPGTGGWITLRPRDDAWDFQSVRLRMDDGLPAGGPAHRWPRPDGAPGVRGAGAQYPGGAGRIRSGYP